MSIAAGLMPRDLWRRVTFKPIVTHPDVRCAKQRWYLILSCGGIHGGGVQQDLDGHMDKLTEGGKPARAATTFYPGDINGAMG